MGIDKRRRPILVPELHMCRRFDDGVVGARMQWNEEDGTIEYGLKGDNVVLQIGQEMVHYVWNRTNDEIPNGAAVFIESEHRRKPTVELAVGNDPAKSGMVGLATEPIPKKRLGYVATYGVVRDFDTFHLDEGELVFLSSTEPGGLMKTLPEAPAQKVYVGYCLRRHKSKGMVIIRPQIIPRIVSATDVHGTPADGDTIRWNATNNRFEFGP